MATQVWWFWHCCISHQHNDIPFLVIDPIPTEHVLNEILYSLLLSPGLWL